MALHHQRSLITLFIVIQLLMEGELVPWPVQQPMFEIQFYGRTPQALVVLRYSWRPVPMSTCSIVIYRADTPAVVQII